MTKFFYSFLIVIFLFCTQIFAQTSVDFFNSGVSFLNEKKYNEAFDAFQKSIRLDNKNAAAHANLGSVLMNLKRPAEAVASYREAIKLVPTEGTFHTALCFALSVSKKHDEAVSSCEEGVRLNGNSVQSHVALIAALRTAKRNDEALQKTLFAFGKFSDDEPLLNTAAEIFSDSGNFSRAAEIYEKLVNLNPKEAYYQVKLAENYLRMERDAEALSAAQKAVETDPKHYLAYFFIGKIYFELGQHEEAVNAFQKSAEINPKFADAQYFLGLSEARREKYEKAIGHLRLAAETSPENFDYAYELASTLMKATLYEESAAAMRKAVALKPNDVVAIAGLGAALAESGQYDEAVKHLTNADRLKPGDQIINMFLNVARSRQQVAPRIGEMIAYAKENPQDLNVRIHLIQNLTFGRRLAEAEPYFAEIWKMNPPDVRVYDMIGTLRSTTGNYEKAAEAYRKSLEFGQSPAAYLGLANVYAKNGQVSEAIAAYNKLFEIKPDSPNIMKLYADYLRDNGKRREALETYKRSLAMLPNNAPVLFNAGVLSAKLGDLDAAKQYLEILKTIDPPSAKLLSRCMKIRW